jgi:aspartate/methionine/tyrosine aminotransferase
VLSRDDGPLDDEHVELQRFRYMERMERFVEILAIVGVEARIPQGGFYLWVDADTIPGSSHGSIAASSTDSGVREPGGWMLARYLAEQLGALVAPGDLYGPQGAGSVRIALVQPMDRLELVAQRAASS